MADSIIITSNVTDGAVITSNVSEATVVTANVVTGAKGDKGETGDTGPAGADAPSDHTLLTSIGTNTHAQIDTAISDSVSHIANTSNPHSVTKTQVGLSNVDNTSDVNKPISTATQTALDGKFTQRTITGTTNQITVTNGDGVSGNPTLALPQDIHTGANPTFLNETLTEKLTTPEIVINSYATGIASSATSGVLRLFGGTLANGAGIVMGGSTHASIANVGILRVSAADVARWTTSAFYPATDSATTLGSSSLYWSNTYTDSLYLNSTAYLDGGTAGEIKGTGIFTADNIKRGTGFPNGVVSAPVGSIYIDTAVTNGASSWIKKTGTGNTGWQVLEGDTGWRDIQGLINTTDFSVAGTLTSYLWIRRVNNTVFLHGRVDTLTATTTTAKQLVPPATLGASLSSFITTDYAPIDTYTASNGWSAPTTLIGRAAWSNSSSELAQFGSGRNISIERSWCVGGGWPTTLPGTAA